VKYDVGIDAHMGGGEGKYRTHRQISKHLLIKVR